MINLSINNVICKDIELIIFDKDGTLFKLYPYCSKMVIQRTNAILKILKTEDPLLKEWLIQIMGVDLENKKIYPEGPIGVYSKYYAMNMLYEKMNANGYEIQKEMLEEAFMEADLKINKISYLKEALEPVDGMLKFMETVGNKCKCAIFSNDMTDRLNDSLDIFKIRTYFDYVLGGDRVKKHKPDPMGLLKIMEELDVSSTKTAFFGDSVPDIESGNRAKCKYVVGVLSDISNTKTLKLNSNALINDFTQIKIDS